MQWAERSVFQHRKGMLMPVQQPLRIFFCLKRTGRNVSLLALIESCGEHLFLTRIHNCATLCNPLNCKSNSRQGFWKQTVCGLDQLCRRVDDATVAYSLRSCGKLKALSIGKTIHDCVVMGGLDSNKFLGNLLVQMYGNCGALENACSVFNSIHEKDQFAWNFLLEAHVDHGCVLILFKQMLQEAVMPDKCTYLSIIRESGNSGIFIEVKRFHAIVSFGSDEMLETTLVNMYGKCGSLSDAWRVFNEMHERDVVAWNAIIAVYAQQNQVKDAVQLFGKMQLEGTLPNKTTFVLIITSFDSQEPLTRSKQVHARFVNSGLEIDVVAGTALVGMYCRAGNLDNAKAIFDNLLQPDVFAWNVMIAGYAQQGKGKDAFQLFGQMLQEGAIPDKVTFCSLLSACTTLAQGRLVHACNVDIMFQSDCVSCNTLINMYANCGSMEDAEEVFDKMFVRDNFSWNAMISGFILNGDSKNTMYFFGQMQCEGILPDKITFVSLFSACASQVALRRGKQAHACIVGNADMMVENALITMYGKCGSLEDAQRTFEFMPAHDEVSWGALIAAYAQHGKGKHTLHVLERMCKEGVKPDQVTFASIISACSHAGLVDEGYSCFMSMTRDHNIQPMEGHYVCIVDLLGRAGRLNEAEDLLSNLMLQLNVVPSMALLCACKSHLDVERGQRLAQLVFQSDPKHASVYIALSDLYAMVGPR